MAFVATCMDKAVDAVLGGAGLAKKGMSKVLAFYFLPRYVSVGGVQ